MHSCNERALHQVATSRILAALEDWPLLNVELLASRVEHCNEIGRSEVWHRQSCGHEQGCPCEDCRVA